MIENPNVKYTRIVDNYNLSYDEYMNFEKKFGYFSDDGKSYTVYDRNTPRQWVHFMVNDTFASVVANDGSGCTALNGFFMRITKNYCAQGGKLRTLNGRRRIKITDPVSCKEYDLFADCYNLIYTVKAGEVIYQGTIENIVFKVSIFVPVEDSCEIWSIDLRSKDGQKHYILTVGEDIAFMNMHLKPKSAGARSDVTCYQMDEEFLAVSENSIEGKSVYAVFSMEKGKVSTEDYKETEANGDDIVYTKVDISREIALDENVKTYYVVSGAAYEEVECKRLRRKYKNADNVRLEKQRVEEKWNAILENNSCVIPDKNLQHFLNVWLKNQIYMTLRYNRCDIIGYRDILQDAWGHLLVKAHETKAAILEALSYMYPDGRCPRQYDRYSKNLDERDFMDSPLWIPITVCDYIKETGDYSIIDEMITYYGSEKKDTVMEHILLSLDYLYHSRGRNGLLLMREGDWLDGLTGIDQYGEATTVWGTMAAYHAQNLMAELLAKIGKQELADKMLLRSKEYKEIVNTVGWDGKWYAYAFIDEEPIGSSQCKEGKIYLNSQSWAIMTGICDDKKRIEKMIRSINTYLMSMYGPHLLAPPYTKYGEKCGRIQKQKPGTFANAAVYLHGASFFAMAYCACGKYDDALDILQRIIPLHEDNCDTRRTMEPYCVGNVYYGVTHPCHGMNLFSWFTATPAWMIHCGFEELLGVKPEYDGLRIDGHEIEDWKEYSVKKVYRGTEYLIHFKKGSEKGIYVDGERWDGNIVRSYKKLCYVSVIF